MVAGMSEQPPIWRSMLFVPAHQQRFIAKAHLRGADAIILDLEDAVPPPEKSTARAMLADAADGIAGHGTAVLVRVNAEGPDQPADLAASVRASVSGLVLPKVDSPTQINTVAAELDRLEAIAGLRRGQTGLIIQIEHVDALPHLDAIANASERVLGLSLGSEDFSVSAGMRPTPDTLYGPNQLVAFACRRAGVLPFGFPASIADYSDPDRFRTTVQRARDMGMVGAFCVHPSQVVSLNEGLAPSDAEVAEAQALVEAAQQAAAKGQGAFAMNGRMVDPPVVARAEEVLRLHAATTKKS